MSGGSRSLLAPRHVLPFLSGTKKRGAQQQQDKANDAGVVPGECAHPDVMDDKGSSQRGEGENELHGFLLFVRKRFQRQRDFLCQLTTEATRMQARLASPFPCS